MQRGARASYCAAYLSVLYPQIYLSARYRSFLREKVHLQWQNQGAIGEYTGEEFAEGLYGGAVFASTRR